MELSHPEIFKAYDIRGVVGQSLTHEIVEQIGQAIGTEALIAGDSAVVVGRDGRISGPSIASALMDGICASGCNTVDIGMVPTPFTYFSSHELGIGSAVSVTGSHNPPDYNGLKVYIDRVVGDIRLDRPLRIVTDCGNGVAGMAAPRLLRDIGCEVSELFSEVDGNFPNHHPDPSVAKNLASLIDTVQREKADLGLAFDGDGDRLGVVSGTGQIIWPDRQMILFAKDILSRNPGAQIVYDVKCSRLLPRAIEQAGGRPLMWKTGHSFIKGKIRETGAIVPTQRVTQRGVLPNPRYSQYTGITIGDERGRTPPTHP